MKTLISLILKDLRRDAKRPWSMVLFASLPLILTSLMASIFGGQGQSASLPTIHIAVLDQDQDLFSKLLRSLPTQGEAARQLRLEFVGSLAQGLQTLERRRASALVVLPTGLTDSLLSGKTNTIELYENPAEQVLPRIVRQGVSLMAVGLSGAAEILHEPLTKMRELLQAKDFPTEAAVSATATQSVQNLRQLRTYLFPPLIQMKTIPAAEYEAVTTNRTGSANAP